MNGGVYKLWMEGSPLYYFGETQDFKKRFYRHIALFKSGKHYQKRLQAAYDTYSIPRMEIIVRCDWGSHWMEATLINLKKNDPNCCNVYRKLKSA